ncbi:Proprotein convertase subtilisin/kexin type 9 [Larimichthys crocea]|uniref:Uncharacterized protein n=1 Tax=Larimichthys crocea TaxID=215358 RepID=A0ACD3RLS3_LARCR|nr:Proprotein convertase subtilisin/kexin type 9 [Larimichthys crocea]
MRRTCGWIGWALCLCASLTVSAQDYPEDDEMILDLIREDGTQPETGAVPAAEFLRCNKAAWRMPGQYLVILRPGTHESHVQRTIRRLRAKAARRGYLLEILQTYSGALHGFLVKMSSDVLHLAVKLPHVHYIEEDSSIFAQSAPWNLQRLLQPHGGTSENGTYKPPSMEYIRAALLASPVEAVVVLLPFVGGFSRSLNTACRDMVANGAVVIAAAGNYRDDACLYSPASEPEVITVGAVNSADQLMSQGAGGTNFGRCVDLFAPGDDIVSASSDCSTCFTSRSGTSQAAAHAAGVAAVILSSNQNMSPVQVLQTMLRYSVSNTINFLSLTDTHRLVTPNLVAAMPPDNSTDVELLCRSVWSERSGVTSTDSAISRCRQGEEMMSCSSYAPDGVHAGETVTVNDGQMECVAYNGPGGKGVFAVARCCVVGGLRCQVHASPKPGQDAECVGLQHHLTGCTSWSTAEILSGSRPHHGDRKRCVVKDGVTSDAVCCHAPVSGVSRVGKHVS